jgi:hypothetical protein
LLLQVEEMRKQITPMRFFNDTKSVEQIIYGIVAYFLNYSTDMPNPQCRQLI